MAPTPFSTSPSATTTVDSAPTLRTGPDGELRLRLFACERCARRKQRCDRILPVCTPCREASGAVCARSEREKGVVRGKDDEITRKGAVTTLLERIACLESEAARRGVVVTDPEPSSSPEGELTTHSMPRMRVENEANSSQHAEDVLPTACGMDISFLSLSAMAEPRSRQEEFLKQLSMARLVAGVTETYGGNPELTARVDPLWDGISQYIRDPVGVSRRLHIPRREAAKALATYLELVDFRFPRLPLAKVQAGIDAISAADDDEYKRVLETDPAHIFMAYAVVAIVPLVSDNYPIAQGSWVLVHLLGKCLRILDRVFNQEDGVDIIQCLQMLVILSLHCSTAGSAWHLVGFAMSKCIALGYHREDSRDRTDVSLAETQQKRWAFWGCYWLDRLICAGLGRPFSIDERDITTLLPNPDGEPEVPGNKEVSYVHLFRYGILLSSVADDPSRGSDTDTGIFELCIGHALEWRASMPSRDNPALQEINLHQTSLFNTLCLRIAIRKILTGYIFDETNNTDDILAYVRYGYCTTLLSPGECLECEQRRVANMNLVDISRAVAQSFHRRRMVRRNFLSFITGYSAFSMGLVCLYCMAVGEREARKTPASASSYPLGELLDVALHNMEIVGRQFPKIHEYRALVDGIRSVVNEHSLPRSGARLHQDARTGTPQSDIRSTFKATLGIGPFHLRQLAQAIVYISASGQQPDIYGV
ncbi:hypothetical protein CkaCkLH20_12761 [Colletotrichum karsti]|uniref:Zn(2)-C6 fungal-type domain-containing protein n=1 Tax=Colletotrichum karsti TaxID=1095194 RepID=A0A9P6HSL1_9PEZI|nr:uncharacterized protein CkaCkLH20_12761 [Colletotrichum karsti]KAF9869718.1 hypothetical protein CkaCkLH20_12761 [Colletotrichum karsti]